MNKEKKKTVEIVDAVNHHCTILHQSKTPNSRNKNNRFNRTQNKVKTNQRLS